jgi:hypothetical protein
LNDDKTAAGPSDAESGIRDYTHTGQTAGYGRTAFNGMNDSLIAFMQGCYDN